MKDFPRTPVRLAIASEPAHLPIVRAAAERISDLMGFDQVTSGTIMLAVDEALTNVIRHAYAGANDKPIEITLTCLSSSNDEEALCIEIRDWGERVDPSRIKARDLDDVRPGGLGVHIMNTVMDEVSYAPAEGGGTCLKMTKKVS